MNSLVSVRPGSAPPLFRSVPASKTSAGAEAVALAADCGLMCDLWQADVLHDALGERPDGNWAAFEVGCIVGRQNGKGSILEARVMAGLLLFRERLIMWSAHEVKTALEAMRRIEALVDANPEIRRMVARNGITKGNGKEGIEFKADPKTGRPGTRLRFVARSRGSGRGFTGDCVILDEAYALTGEQMSALMPTMSARPNPQIWYTSSPPLTSDTGEVLFALRERAYAGDPGLCYLDWGVQGVDLGDLTGVGLDDREVWAATNPAYGVRRSDGTGLTEAFTARERAAMTPVDFARERLGIWPPKHTAGSTIDLETWAALAEAESVAGEMCALAVDVTPLRDHASIAMYSVRPDGIGHIQLLDHREGTEWLLGRLLQLKARWNPAAIAVDIRSPAGSLLTELEKLGVTRSADPDRPKRGDLIVPTTYEAAAACGQFVDAVRQASLRHIGSDTPLTIAIGGAKTRPMGDSWGWGRRVSTIDISPLCAATLARWAYEQRAHIVRKAYDPLANFG